MKLGYIEGRNLTIEYAFAAGDNSRLPALTEDLVRLAVDLIVTDGGDEVAWIAHWANRTCRSLGEVVHPKFRSTERSGIRVEILEHS